MVKHPLLRLFLDNKRYWPGLFLMVILAGLAGVFKTRAATLWGEAVDFGVSGLTDAMLQAALLMLLFIVIDGIRTGVHYTVIGQVTERMFKGVRTRIFNILLKADSLHLENKMRSGDLALRVGADTDRLCHQIAGNFSHHSRLIIQALFAVTVSIILSWQLAVAYFILLPISIFVLSIVSKRLTRLQSKFLSSSGRSADIVSDAISGITAVKMFALEKEMDRRFAEHVDSAYDRFKASAKIDMEMTAIRYIVMILQTLVLFIVGAWLVGEGIVTIGTVMAFVVLAAYVTEAFNISENMIRNIKQTLALSIRLYEVLDLPVENEGETTVVPQETGINFKDYNFAYGDTYALQGLNLHIKKGQKIGIVGSSGSGKSTIIKLICRLYGHGTGEFTLFGANGDKIYLPELRKKLALVSQEPSLFETSILENVRMGKETATDDEVISALKSADLWDFIKTLPDGVHTNLGEFGSRLSGGQKQRLSIARAFVKQAELVLLDEATSALDSKSEQEIKQALDNLLKDRTAIIVAHRLTTVQDVDYIYCLNEGRVIEEGNPAVLYKQKGYFYEMCMMQEVKYV